jgi:hypothetical protein
MEFIVGLLVFGVAWWLLNTFFVKLFGRMMSFGEGIIYPIILALFGAWIVGQLGPSKEERLARDIQEYNRLNRQIRGQEAEERYVQECLRQAIVMKVSKTYLDCQREYRR